MKRGVEPGIPAGVPGSAALPDDPWQAAWTPRTPGPTQLDAVPAWERTHGSRLGEPGPDLEAVVPRIRRRHPLLTILAAILIAAATGYGWFAGSNLLASRAIPAVRGWQVVAVVSGSMEPALSPGDVLGYETYDGQKLVPGAVIVFDDPARPGTLMTHRVVEILDDGRVRTRGDANADPDSTPVPVDAIVGIGRMVVPGAALPVYWWQAGDTVRFAVWATLSIVALLIATTPTDGSRRRRRRLAPALASVLGLLLIGSVVTVGMRAEAAFTGTAGDTGASFSAFLMAHTGFIGEATCGGSTSQVTVGRSVAAGETVVIRVRLRDTSGSVATSATDTRGNTYKVDAEVADANRARVAILSARVTTALQAGDQITVRHRDNQASAVTVGGFSGVAASGRVVTTATATGNATSVSIPVTVAEANTLFVGTTATRNASNVTGTPGWQMLDSGDVSCGSLTMGRAASWEILGSPVPMVYAPSFDRRERFAAAVVVYRAEP